MFVQNLLRQLAATRVGRNGRRRRSINACGHVAVQTANLEPRVLLAAAVVSELPDISLTSTFRDHYTPLAEHFDDPAVTGRTVEVQTSLGNFVVETYDTITPNTANNFVDLTEAGRYEDMFFHRSVPGFVLQGGGFTYPEDASQVGVVEDNGNVANEFDNWFDPNLGGLAEGTPLNVRGTLAMARQGGLPDSANSQWFVNVDDNSGDLDGIDGGFTVFGHVLYDGLTTVDAIVAIDRVNAGGAFATLPVIDYTSGQILRQHLVTSTTTIVDELQYEVTANSAPDVLNASIVSGQLLLTGTPGKSGTASVTVTATDHGGNSVSSTMQVTIPVSSALVSPGPGGHDLRPVIEWVADPNAVAYELWVNHVGGTNRILHQAELTTTSFTPTTDLPIGTYNAWVKATDAQGAGVWSDLHAFRVGLSEVTITSPDSRFADSARPVIEWTSSETATEYDLWVNHIGVENQIIRETSLTSSSFTPTADLADGVYRVWVKAKNANEETDWSVGVTFEVSTVTAPEFTGPTEPSSTARPTLTWSGSETDVFELWVNKVGGDARVIHQEDVTSNSYLPTADLANGTYRAWVRLRPANSEGGQWSSAFEFAVATAPATIQITDVTGTDTPRPTFTWPAADRAVRYELWVNDVSNGVPRVIWLTDLTELQYAHTADLPTGSYRAWLRAFSAGNVAGEWSDAFEFELV